jgi:hypothetical protein
MASIFIMPSSSEKVDKELRAIFRMKDLTSKVQRLKNLMLSHYPEGGQVSLKGNRLAHLFFACDWQPFYFWGAGITLDSNALFLLCHDDDIVARFKPVFYELIKEWAVAEVSHGRYYSSMVDKLNIRLEKLGFQEFDLISFRHRVLIARRSLSSVDYSKAEARKKNYSNFSLENSYELAWGLGDFYRYTN